MSALSIGSLAPPFSVPQNGGTSVSLNDYKGRYLVLYFYPRDDTPGCTLEAIDFTAQKENFAALGTDILGISRDSVAKHEKFIAKHTLAITLGADIEGKTTDDYGVWVEKKNYGKTYMGIERTTFLIGPDGTILHIWKKVRVKAHVETILETLRELQS